MELARKEGIQTVATNDCHYISQADAQAHDILLCIGTGKKAGDEHRMRYPGDQFYFKSSRGDGGPVLKAIRRPTTIRSRSPSGWT